MSIDEYANTQCVVCKHCGSELRVWYTPNPNAPPQQEAGCPACRKGISLNIRATIESVEMMPPENSSDKSRLSPQANRGLISTLCDVFAKKIASNKRRKDV
jgi:hypothetical protein